MSQPQDNAAGLFKHISLKAPAKPKLSNLPVFQLKPPLTKQSFSLPKIGVHKPAESTSSESYVSIDDTRSEIIESQKIDATDSSRKRLLEPPFELPASKRAKFSEDRQSSLDLVAPPLPPVESVETNYVDEYHASDAEIAQYQDYFVERTNENEKILESIIKELDDTKEGLKELNVQLLTINNEMLVYNNPIFSGHNPHLEKEE